MNIKDNRILHILSWVFMTLLLACEPQLTPLEKSGNVPDPVRNVTVENFPGSAVLTYDLPPGKELWYVKASYEIRPGVQREKKATYYTNQLVLDGFGDTGTYEVTLNAVGRDGQTSESVTVEVQPDTPPIKKVYESLTIDEDFGGVRIGMENEDEADVVLQLVAIDSLGNWAPVETYYTSQQSAMFFARGLDPEERDFGVYVRDRWENYSDTLVRSLTPYFEEELDKSNFAEVRLPTDTWQKRYASSAGVPGIWDGNRAQSGQNHNFQSILPSSTPQWFTFDLGVIAKLSRMQYWMKHGLFNEGNAKVIEVWGSTAPNPDGSWDSWTLLATFESVKPSGLPIGQNSPEDVAHAAAGDDFTFPPDAPPVRYIRFKTVETWGPSWQNVWVNEISLFGAVQQ